MYVRTVPFYIHIFNMDTSSVEHQVGFLVHLLLSFHSAVLSDL
jgi:hypothetical protein